MYANRSAGPLSFWYEEPQINEAAFHDGLSYFMWFQGKALYRGPFDASGVPLLDYLGDIGVQYNPIAIAQYGLARFNQWVVDRRSVSDERAWRSAAAWLVAGLRPNTAGVEVWMHDFDWPYREPLKAPWFSGLAQGSGVSMLVRAALATSEERFANATHTAFESLRRHVSEGGVLVTDDQNDLWIEEYLVAPPSHVLNGFMWALWGVYDYARWSGSTQAADIFERCIRTLERRLHEFDTGWWSLYEARCGRDEMLASRYYHQLHITQLRVLHRLTGKTVFSDAAGRFESYLNTPHYRARALMLKTLFKLRRY